MNPRTGLYLTYVFYLLIIVGILFATIYPRFVVAKAVEETKNVEIEIVQVGYSLGDQVPQEVIDRLVRKYASPKDVYGITRTIYCESHNWNVQSNIINSKGQRELSFGVAQIHLPSHPNITREQALDVEWSIRWMASNFDKVTWYGWNKNLDTCN